MTCHIILPEMVPSQNNSGCRLHVDLRGVLSACDCPNYCSAYPAPKRLKEDFKYSWTEAIAEAKQQSGNF